MYHIITVADIHYYKCGFWPKWGVTGARQMPGTQSNPFKINFRQISYLISHLVRFILNFSHIGLLAMVAEAPDPHHGGPGHVGDG